MITLVIGGFCVVALVGLFTTHFVFAGFWTGAAIGILFSFWLHTDTDSDPNAAIGVILTPYCRGDLLKCPDTHFFSIAFGFLGAVCGFLIS